MRAVLLACCVAACGGNSGTTTTDAAAGSDAGGDASATVDAAPSGGLGTVTAVTALPGCPGGAPPGATCEQVTVTGCPGIASESIDAVVAVLPATGTVVGTVVHFTGAGGEGFEKGGMTEYQAAGLRQIFVSWKTDWELTLSSGIKAAACRPATVLKWAFTEPTLHAASRTQAFCGEGFSAGSGQLGYALAHYGLADYLDYVNELSGPPFARIDLGCDGSAPATTTVCGATVTMKLPPQLDQWENIAAPNSCGGTGITAAELARWNSDSIAVGGLYAYPKTSIGFFDCTHNATAVTGMAQIYYDQIAQAEGGTTNVSYHCYAQADGCVNEQLGTGNADAIAAMIAGCTPRHM